MRKKRITIGMLSMMMAVSSVFGGVNVSAATPKLTANQVYDSTTMIKGKVKKGTTVKVKIGKKTYSVVAGIGGSWGLGALGAKGGAAAGAAIGTAIMPGVGTAIGGAVGGLVLGIAGSYGGNALGRWVVDITAME